MKVTIPTTKEVIITHVEMSLAVRYDEEDIPNDFPMRHGDMWRAKVEIDTGKIVGWPQGRSGEMYMKVCDCGSYWLIDALGNRVASIEADYVPNKLIPGEYGDYVDFKIDKKGVITNWPKNPDVCQFFDKDE